jgi:hypothetical protein
LNFSVSSFESSLSGVQVIESITSQSIFDKFSLSPNKLLNSTCNHFNFHIKSQYSLSFGSHFFCKESHKIFFLDHTILIQAIVDSKDFNNSDILFNFSASTLSDSIALEKSDIFF